MYFPFELFPLLYNLFIFHLFGLFGLILFIPHLLEKNIKKNKYLDTYLMILAASFTFISFLGYFLDVFFNISKLSIYLTLFCIISITFFIRKIYFIRFWGYCITLWHSRENIIKNYYLKFSSNRYFYYIILLAPVLIISIYAYSVRYLSLPTTDPLATFEKITLSLKFSHISWTDREEWIGLKNWPRTVYPAGFYINLVFLSIFNQNNLFFIMKFFGPTLSIISNIVVFKIGKKITNNPISGLISSLLWYSTYINFGFSGITVASILGLFLALSSILIILENSLESDILSAACIGGGMLVHSFAGNVFILVSMMFYLLYNKNGLENKKQSRFYNIARYYFVFGITMLPYIVLFRFPDAGQLFGNIISLNIGQNLSSITCIIDNNISLLLQSFNIGIIWKWNHFLECFIYIGLFGPSLLTYFLIPFCFSEKKFEMRVNPFLIGLLIITFAYIFNPLTLNGIGLRSKLDLLYDWRRVVWFASIPLCIFAGIGYSNLESISKKYVLLLKQHNFHYTWDTTKFGYVILLFILANQLKYAINISPEMDHFWFKTDFPSDYTETILWLNENASPGSNILTSEENFTISNSDFFTMFYRSHGNNLNVISNNSYFPFDNQSSFFPLEEHIDRYLNDTLFFSYDYIIISKNNITYFSILENRDIISLVFLSEGNQFYTYKINNIKG